VACTHNCELVRAKVDAFEAGASGKWFSIFDALFGAHRVTGEVKGEDTFFLIVSIHLDGAPGRTRTCGNLLRRYALKSSKCRYWCRLRGSASFISPLNWTEDGLKWVG
jgi:hypothetical protein